MAKHTKTEATATAPALMEPTAEVVTTTTVVAPAQPTSLTEEQDQHIRAMKTKSEQMRFLASLGWKNGPIAKYLSGVWGKTVIYQHVRNVLRQPMKKS